MVAMRKNLVLSLLILIVLILVFTKADSNNKNYDTSSASSFECGNPQEAMEISDDTTNSVFFDTIKTDLGVNTWNNRKSQQHLVPKTIHWHIYAIDNGETPKYSCYPEGLVEPQISGSTLQLAAVKDRLKDLGYHKGDKIQSAINLYIPLQQLRNIQMDGVAETMEVVVTDTLLTNATTKNSSLPPSIRIRSTGVDSTLYVNAPYSPIYFSGSGVDTDATIVAGRNSTVELSGVDQRVRIKSEHLTGKVRLSGIDTRLMLDGDYDAIDMSGIDCQVQVNGPSGCNSVHNSGINNNCRVASSSDANVTVPSLECLSTTTVVEPCDVSVGAVVGVSVGLLVVIGFCVFGCIYSCRRRRRQQQQEGQLHKDVSSPPGLQVPESSMSPAMAIYDPQKVPHDHQNVVEAEVIEIEPSTTTLRDPELANGIDAKVYA